MDLLGGKVLVWGDNEVNSARSRSPPSPLHRATTDDTDPRGASSIDRGGSARPSRRLAVNSVQAPSIDSVF
jgi:hypothetical protein